MNIQGENKTQNRIYSLLPLWIVVGIFMIGPLLVMAVVSLMESNVYGGVHFKFSLSGYRQILFDTNLFDEIEFNPAYLIIIGRSFMLALVATFISLLIGFPAAYFISRQSNRVKNILIFLVTIPFWTNLLIRTFAWIIILGKGGVIESSFNFFGLLDEESSLNLMYTNSAILIGLVYSYLPLMVLPIYASMEKMDLRLLEAATDLYSNRIELIRKIILPLSMPGIIGGSILGFCSMFRCIYCARFIGGWKKIIIRIVNSVSVFLCKKLAFWSCNGNVFISFGYFGFNI